MITLKWAHGIPSGIWWTRYRGYIIRSVEGKFTCIVSEHNEGLVRVEKDTLADIIQEIDEDIEDTMHLHT
jgi:hypothetical protein